MRTKGGKDHGKAKDVAGGGVLKTVSLRDLGAFSDLSLELSEGFNVLTGMNGTGKTHFLQFVRAGLTAVSGDDLSRHFAATHLFPDEFSSLLLHRPTTSSEGFLMLEGETGDRRVFAVSKSGKKSGKSRIEERESDGAGSFQPKSVFFFPDGRGFPDRSFGKPRAYRSALVRRVEKTVPGRVCSRNGNFWIKNARGWTRWAQVSPATRQLGLLSVFLRQGALIPGSVLLWDTPEGMFGPLLAGELAGILLSLTRSGIQVVVSTRDYVFLKEVDLRQTDEDAVRYHVFFRDDRLDKISAESASSLSGLSRNPASDALRSLFDRDVDRAVGRLFEGH